ncbi:hypothetical protein [Laspinema palackyanum]|uniref:hypothetical protein n=1 Tax=Laspinema palackyanum TaxID=3231601 RepID=UPI00345D2C88|nr:hypothetical protein [Laspinema sp. D2c]
MDSTQFYPVIEQILNYVHERGAENINYLTDILTVVKAFVMSVSSLATIVANWSTLMELWTQVIALATSGAGLTEISTVVAQFATLTGISIQAIIDFLQVIIVFFVFI